MAKLVLATLCLNEMEHLPRLYAQHRAWPGLSAWVFVEAADAVYASTNPSMVSERGLSVDGTSEFLHKLSLQDPRVKYIPHGLCSNADPAQGKVAARNRYAQMCESVGPDFLFVLDADEYYTAPHQNRALELMAVFHAQAYVFRQRHIWKPPASPRPLFVEEAVGGYWGVPHIRGWKWAPGRRYGKNHNWLEERDGMLLNARPFVRRFDLEPGTPECVHLGYASSLESRSAKHKYYVARGEGSEPGRVGAQRRMYVECRSAYEAWTPGSPLPHGARVLAYAGPIPECFTDGSFGGSHQLQAASERCGSAATFAPPG